MRKLEFRQAAIEHETSSEQFKELIRLVKPHDWMILLSLCFILSIFIIWGIFGKVPTSVTGQGILLGSQASIFDAIAPEGSTRVLSINVKPGDTVAKDDVVAYLDDPDLSKDVVVADNYLQLLKDKYNALKTTSQSEIKEREAQFQQQQNIEQETLKIHTAELATVKDLLERKQILEKKGIMSREEVVTTLLNYYSAQKEIENTRKLLIQNQEAFTSFKQDWSERLLKLELQIIDAQRDLNKLNNQLALSKIVRSPVAGIITNVQVAIGDSVKEGDPIVSIASKGTGLDAIIFVPAQEGQRVKENMLALVSPDIIEKEKYGSLEGRVISVSTFPIPSSSLQAVLHNKDLVDRFMKNGVPISLRVKILSDPNTFSGYKWSSTTGPHQKVTPGMVVTAKVTVEKQSPISLIIPAFNKILEGE